MTTTDVETFIIKHKDWIIKHLTQDKIDLYDPKLLTLWGNRFEAKYTQNRRNHLLYDGETLLVFEQYDLYKSLETFYKRETIKEMTRIINEEKSVLKEYFDMFDLSLKSQLMKSRLGSCISTKKIIKLNSLLARFDKKYLKIVLYHELVHLNIQNHSQKFYKLLNNICPNYRSINKELKEKIAYINYL
jgi:predicted metal-dependent hydrolase